MSAFSYINKLNSREQKTVYFALPVVFFLSLWLFLIDPLLTQHSVLRVKQETSYKALQWMQEHRSKVNVSKDKLPSSNNVNLRQEVERLFRLLGIRHFRLKGISEDTVNLSLRDAEFNILIKVISELENQNIFLDQARISKSKIKGKVSAELAFTTKV
ncbi:MAG: type II secretion system protein GspM [Neptuniibacter sp.]